MINFEVDKCKFEDGEIRVACTGARVARRSVEFNSVVFLHGTKQSVRVAESYCFFYGTKVRDLSSYAAMKTFTRINSNIAIHQGI